MGTSEVADLFVKLSLITGPFSSSLAAAGLEGESFVQKMGGIGPAMTKVGGMVAAAGLGIGVVSLKMAGDWQASMIKLTTSAGETGTVIDGKLTGPIKQVSDGLLKMSVDTATSTKSLADGMYYVESAGFHGAQGLQVMKAAAEGAKAEGANLTTVADALTTGLHDMGMGADQAVPMMNMMVRAVGDGKMTMEQFAGSLHSVLPQAHAAGISFPEVAAAIATMTVAGTSADQATMMLGHTISSLQTPNALAVKWMSQMGLSSVDLMQHLGDRGLSGTLDLVGKAILNHMGPSGLVLQSAFNKSSSAASDLNVMLAAMPPKLRTFANEVQNGTLTAKDYSKAIEALPANLQAQGAEFLTLYKNSSSFNAALRAGTPDALTFAGMLRKVLGDTVDTNTAMQVAGTNMGTYKNNIDDIALGAKNAGTDIETWGTITQGFNFKMDQMKQQVATLAIKIGMDLIPTVQHIITWMVQHKTAVEDLAKVIVGVLLVALAMWIKSMAVALVMGIKDAVAGLVTLGTRIGETSAKMVGAEASTVGWAGKLGGALPIIGIAVTGIAMLGQKLGQMSGVGDHTAMSVDKLNTAMLGISTTSPKTQKATADMGIALAHMSQMMGTSVDGLKSYDQSLAQLVSSGHLTDAKVIMDQITAATDSHGKALINTARDFPQYFAALDQAANAAKSAATATDGSSSALSHNATTLTDDSAAAKAAAAAIAGVTTQQQDLSAGINASRALDNFNQQVKALTQSLKDNGTSITGDTDAAMNNRSAILNATQAIVDNYNAQTSLSGPSGIPAATQKMRDQIQQLINQSSQSGATRTAIQNYINTLNMVPHTVSTSVNVDTSNAMARINAVRIAMIGIAPGAGFGARAMASGGLVTGPGTATSDSVPTRLSAGEFVLEASAVSKVPLEALKALNRGDIQLAASMMGPQSGISPGGARGGSYGGAGVVHNTYVTVNVAGSVLAERDLRDVLQTQMLQLGARNSTSYTPYKR